MRTRPVRMRRRLNCRLVFREERASSRWLKVRVQGVQLTASSTYSASWNMERDGSSKLPASKGSEQIQHTLRFALELKESSDKYFPEFSFRELLRGATVGEATGEAKYKTKNKDKIWAGDGDSEDEKLQQLAKQFEEKYGPNPKAKKRRRERIADLVDVTYGYDETDPFVDNSEAYDELIPADWTTEHGGFYINQGGLKFRPISSDESDDDFKGVKKKKTPKKLKDPSKVKKLKTPLDKEKKRKHLSSSDKDNKPRKVRLTSGDKEIKKHKKKLNMNVIPPSGTILNMMSSARPAVTTTSTTSLSTSSVSVTPCVSNGTATPAGTSTASSPQDSIKAESINEDSIPLALILAANVSAAETPESVSAVATVTQNGLAGDGISEDITSIVPKLPQFLPAQVEACVESLKQAASNASSEGKCKFFNKDVNHMLLGIETKSRELSCRVRSSIYDYLAFYLPCTKETLLKRAKKLLLTDQAGRLREPMAKLKAAVDKVIPEQVKAFEEEVRKHVEEESKASDLKQGIQEQSADDKKKEMFKSAMEFEEEGEKTENGTTPAEQPSTIASQTEDKAKKMVPKRKFVWTQELRQLLNDVVTVKVKLFEMSKTRTTSAEEFLKEFFESEVKLLWPKGWMTARILFRESKAIHSRFTSAPFRAKKAPVPKKQGEASPIAPPDTSNQSADISKEEKTVSSEGLSSSSVLQPSSTAAAVIMRPTALTPGLAKPVPVTGASAASSSMAPITTTSIGMTKLALKITPVAVSNLPPSVTTVKLISSVSTPASRLISSLATVARLTTCSAQTSSTASLLLSKPLVTQSLPVETVGAATKSENTVIKRTHLTEGQKQLPSVGIPSPSKTVPGLKQPLQTEQQSKVTAESDNFSCLTSVVKSQPVTILDFADMVSADSDGQDILGKPLQSQPLVSNSPSQNIDTNTSIVFKSLPSPQRQNMNYAGSSPSKVMRSPPQIGQAREQPSHIGRGHPLSPVTDPQRVSTGRGHPLSPATDPQRVSTAGAPAMTQVCMAAAHPVIAMTRLVSAANIAQPARVPTASVVRQPVANPVTTPPRVSASSMAMSREQMQHVAQGRDIGMHAGVAVGNRRMSDSIGATGMSDLQNNFIDLNAAAMISHQRQQAAANKALLDAIASTSRMSMNLGSNASVPLTHPVISRQLSNPTQTGYHLAATNLQPQILSMLGHGTITSKTTTPLSHMGMLPPQPAVMHLSQQQQHPYSQDPSQPPGSNHPPSPYIPRFS